MSETPKKPRPILALMEARSPNDYKFQKVIYKTNRSIMRYAGFSDDGPDFALLHGGGWYSGKPGDKNYWLDYLLPRSRSVNMIEYGVAALHRSTIEDSFKDARAAAQWIAEVPAAKAGVVLMGFSAGAAMAVDVALTMAPDDVAGLLLFSPVTDLSADGFKSKMTGDAGHLNLSPVHRIAQDAGRLACPCLIFHGVNDSTVPLAASRHFAQVWRQTQTGPCHLFEVPQCGHGLDKLQRGFARSCAELDAHFFSPDICLASDPSRSNFFPPSV